MPILSSKLPKLTVFYSMWRDRTKAPPYRAHPNGAQPIIYPKNLAEARDYASKHGYGGIRVQVA